MPRNTSIVLGDHFARFVDAQVQEGRYGSASDVIRAGLRLLEDQETRLATLRAALVAGEESGPAQAFDFEAFLADKQSATDR
jgi:antitoxin ParD1/3/4